MGKLSRTKGAAYERVVSAFLRSIFGPNVRRGLQSRGGGKEVPDVTGEDLPSWIHIEAQHAKQASPWVKLRQAEDDAPDKKAVVFIKKHGGEELVGMRPETFKYIMERMMDDRTKN